MAQVIIILFIFYILLNTPLLELNLICFSKKSLFYKVHYVNLLLNEYLYKLIGKKYIETKENLHKNTNQIFKCKNIS